MTTGSPPGPDHTFNWSAITTVLLDMDGTLLDKYFDDFFWEDYVPQVFAQQNGLSHQQARESLLQRYRAVESTLQWTDLDFWSEELGLDIPALKNSVDHLIKVHPHVLNFLDFLEQQGKTTCLVTAAHDKTLQIKLAKTEIGPRFDRIVCAGEIGLPKQNPLFWLRLEEALGFQRSQTLLADDTAKVLQAARQHGIEHLVFVAKPSSRSPVRPHTDFFSITAFDELMR
ncbi:MAG: HAD-IA family hydrolase [Desulfofustis sp.]|nr:HAD-IA family hydrolase [Desulfofustis sp.]